MTKKKHILESKLTEKTNAWGIVTSNSEFQMTMLLNENCNLNLQMSKPFEKLINYATLRFPCSYENRDETVKIHLIKNSHQGYILINVLKDIDYFLIITGEYTQEFIKSMNESIRNCHNIELVNILNENQIKKLLQLKPSAL